MRIAQHWNGSRIALLAVSVILMVGLTSGCRFRTGGGGGGGGTGGTQDGGTDAEDPGDGVTPGETDSPCEDVNECIAGDGCCPQGCEVGTDADCGAVCGNGQIESGETCDGDCPADCSDSDPCVDVQLQGSAENCTAECVRTDITTCSDGDGCCPASCDNSTDNDCSDSCGDGVVDPGETCDGDCPTSCDQDADPCTTHELTGSASNCTAECTESTITSCSDGDGCCPSGCSSSTDNDCTADSVVGDSCTSHSACGSNFSCVQSVITGGYCSTNCTSDSDCPGDAHCGFKNSQGDGLCLENCTSDSDCGRSGYKCFDADNGGTSECWPTGTGFGDVGDSCSSYSNCDHGENGACVAEGSQFKGGYCIWRYCNSTTSCPSGSHCFGDSSGDGQCMEDCSSDFDCRSDGYACFDRDGDGTDECYSAATGSKSIGDACMGTWECGSGEWGICIPPSSDVPDGYCTELCDTGQGSCPSGSTCTDLGSSRDDLCFDNCASSSDCRSGYNCTSPSGQSQDVCIPAP